MRRPRAKVAACGARGLLPLAARAVRALAARLRACVHAGKGAAVEPTKQILFDSFAAVCLGALVGLERQVSEHESEGEKDFPGVRTFAFTALLGALAVLLSRELGPWMGIALFAASASFLVMRYRFDVQQHADPGYTTEIAALCTFVVGALAQTGQLLVATAITIAMLVLLRVKRVMRRVESLLSPRDMESLIRFLVITGIVFPLLPDEPLAGFYGVLRPRDVWRMVVLISGISFVGFVLMRLELGSRGHVLSGLLGGLVSSTAATVAYARAAQRLPQARPFETMAALAAATPPLRILVMVAVVAPSLAVSAGPPLAGMFALGLALGLLRHRARSDGPVPAFQNPLTLRLALSFAAIYAVALVALAAARDWFGESGVYVTSALAAVPGADAPALSLARLAADGRIGTDAASAALLIAAACSGCVKCAILIGVGRSRAMRRVALSTAVVVLLGALGAAWFAMRAAAQS